MGKQIMRLVLSEEADDSLQYPQADSSEEVQLRKALQQQESRP